MSGKRNVSVCRGHELANALYKRPGGVAGVYGKGHLGVSFYSMCAEGMGCEIRWVRWVLWGTGTASGHQEVS